MEIRIKAIHFDATAKLEEFINKKAQKLARRNESVTGFDVTLKVVKPETALNKEASIKLTVPTARICLPRRWPTRLRKRLIWQSTRSTVNW